MNQALSSRRPDYFSTSWLLCTKALEFAHAHSILLMRGLRPPFVIAHDGPSARPSLNLGRSALCAGRFFLAAYSAAIAMFGAVASAISAVAIAAISCRMSASPGPGSRCAESR